MKSRFEINAELMSLGPDGKNVDEFLADLFEAAVVLTRAAQLVPVTSAAGRAVTEARNNVTAAAGAFRYVLPTASAHEIESGGAS